VVSKGQSLLTGDYETKGRSIEEIDAALTKPALAEAPAA
jgi:hypothetical protein